MDSGKELIELVDKNLNISEIGLSAPFTKNGYFFLCAPPKKETKVYQYALTNIVLEDGNYKALQVTHLSNIPLSYSTTFESIKKDIIQNSKPNSGLATYLIESELYFPWEESLLPVAKRRFIEYLTKQPTSNF